MKAEKLDHLRTQDDLIRDTRAVITRTMSKPKIYRRSPTEMPRFFETYYHVAPIANPDEWFCDMYDVGNFMFLENIGKMNLNTERNIQTIGNTPRIKPTERQTLGVVHNTNQVRLYLGNRISQSYNFIGDVAWDHRCPRNNHPCTYRRYGANWRLSNWAKPIQKIWNGNLWNSDWSGWKIYN